MPTLNDEMMRQLGLSGRTGTLNDRLRQQLGAAANETLNDAWMRFLGAEGYDGRLNDRMLAFYRDVTGLTTATLNDAALAAWIAGNPLAP